MPRSAKKPATKRTELGQFLDDEYIKWRDAQPNRRGPFAVWAKDVVKIKREVLNGYINRGSMPEQKMVEVLADRFGGQIYSLCDAFPPDPIFRRIAKVWWRIPDAAKEEIAEMADRKAEQGVVGARGQSLEKVK